MFRLGAITDELSLTFDGALSLATELGIQDVEIHTVGRKSVEDLSPDEIVEVGKKLQDHNLKVCNISSTMFLRCHLVDDPQPIEWRTPFRSISGSYTDHLDKLARCLEIASRWQSPYVRVFGFWQEGPLTDEVLDKASDRMQKPVDMAKAAGIPLVLENCPHTYFDWGARAVKLVKRMNSPWFGFLWDPCAGIRNGEVDIMAPFEDIQPVLRHVHAKDMVFEPGSKHGHSYVPVGQGVLGWQKVVNRLAAGGYEGVVCIETHHLAADGSKETAARATWQGLSDLVKNIR